MTEPRNNPAPRKPQAPADLLAMVARLEQAARHEVEFGFLVDDLQYWIDTAPCLHDQDPAYDTTTFNDPPPAPQPPEWRVEFLGAGKELRTDTVRADYADVDDNGATLCQADGTVLAAYARGSFVSLRRVQQ